MANYIHENNLIWTGTRTARVILQFTIEETGELTDMKVIKNTISAGNGAMTFLQMNNNIKGIIKRAPGEWIPARVDNKFVRRRYRMVVVFNHPDEIADAEQEQILPIWPVSFYDEIDPNHYYSLYSVSKMPRYRLGREKLINYLNDSAYHRVKAKPKSMEGYVDVEYVIKSDSSLIDFQILKHSKVYPEHLKVVHEMISDMEGDWLPAEINGTPVHCVQRHRVYFHSKPGKNKGLYKVYPEETFGVVAYRAPYSNHMAMFRGSESDYKAMIRQNLLYPIESLKHCVDDELNIRCIVELDGSLNEFYIAPKDSVGYGCDIQAIQALKSTNYQWTPAHKKNHFVRSQQQMKVRFKIGFSTPEQMILNEGEGRIFENYQVDSQATYKMGLDSFYSKVQSEFKYPMLASKYNKGGKVMVSVVVERDGSLSNIKVLNEEERYYCFEEAVQQFIMETDGDWRAARYRRVPVRSKVILPLLFVLK